MPKVSVITPTIRPEGLNIMQDCLSLQTFQDFEWLLEIGFPNKSDLNQALNRMVKRAKGELLVFYQDYIGIRPDGLERFWNEYEKDKTSFLTASVNDDWRLHNVNKPLEFTQWEIDWGACSREALVKIGGFDETLDQYWGFDNVNVGLRATMAGHRIMTIHNPAIGYKHEEAPMKKNRNEEYHNYRLQQIRQGLKVDFLRG